MRSSVCGDRTTARSRASHVETPIHVGIQSVVGAISGEREPRDWKSRWVLHGERSAKDAAKVLLKMRGTPTGLAHGAPADAPWGVVEPHPVVARAWRLARRGGCAPTSENTTPSGAAAAQQPTQDEPMDHEAASSSVIVSSGGENVKEPADPTLEEEIPMSEVKRHTFCQCPIRSSTQRDVQVAREMDTITTHNVNVELPTESSQRNSCGRCQSKCQRNCGEKQRGDISRCKVPSKLVLSGSRGNCESRNIVATSRSRHGRCGGRPRHG